METEPSTSQSQMATRPMRLSCWDTETGPSVAIPASGLDSAMVNSRPLTSTSTAGWTWLLQTPASTPSPSCKATGMAPLGRGPALGAGPVSVAICDLDSDGNQDLAVANAGSWNVSVLLGRGDGTFSPTTNYPAGSPASYI